MTAEATFDALVGPTHSYAGLSPGNLAATGSRGQVSNPRQAALQRLAKMRLLRGLGVLQGLLPPLDRIVLVAVSSAHRGESFQACEFLMDYLKTQAPFWKKEQTPEGARWVDARVSDDAALAKWGIQATNS